ncbi:MAG: hypothetical protein B6D38_07060 [Anaerolineae bacterium UTCFX1]|nr:MAG: hypothetical protein B6D38_07060 [Anaerolineae bacterium UTCFX1]
MLIVRDETSSIAASDSLFSQQNCIVLAESSVRTALQTARLMAPSLALVNMQVTKRERGGSLKKPAPDRSSCWSLQISLNWHSKPTKWSRTNIL